MAGPCKMRNRVDRHFEGRINPEEERDLRRHLSNCVTCREHYEHLLLQSMIDPKSIDSQSRMAIGLGILPRRRKPLMPVLALAASFAAVLTLILFIPGTTEPEKGFSIRGPDGSPANLLIYRLHPGKAPALVVDEITGSDELAFAYENNSGKGRLLVFGVDEHENIYWYYPSWAKESENPVAVPIQTNEGVHELPEAVTHSIKGNSLRIYAVFTDEPLSVRETEERLLNLDFKETKIIENAFQTTTFVKVRH